LASWSNGLPTTSSQFTSAIRDLTPGAADYFSDTSTAYAMLDDRLQPGRRSPASR
jgi:hypothetical protein